MDLWLRNWNLGNWNLWYGACLRDWNLGVWYQDLWSGFKTQDSGELVNGSSGRSGQFSRISRLHHLFLGLGSRWQLGSSGRGCQFSRISRLHQLHWDLGSRWQLGSSVRGGHFSRISRLHHLLWGLGSRWQLLASKVAPVDTECECRGPPLLRYWLTQHERRLAKHEKKYIMSSIETSAIFATCNKNTTA